MSGSQVLSHSLLILYQNWLQKSSFFFGICNLFVKDKCHGGGSLLFSYPRLPSQGKHFHEPGGIHLILPSSSTYIIPRLVAKCQVYSTLHHYSIVLFPFSTFTTNFQLLSATSVLVERGEVVPIKVKVCTRAHNIVGSSARFPTYTLSLLFYIGGRESF